MKAQNIDALVAEYVSGDLTESAAILVNAHMELTPESRTWAEKLETVAGYELDGTAPADLKDQSSMLDAILSSNAAIESNELPIPANDQPDNWMPAALKEIIGVPANEVPWRMKLPGVYVHQIGKIEGCDVSLLKIKPGVGVPTHTHEGRELTLVLQGSFSDGDGEYQRGDIAIADDDVDHKPIAGMGEECICFVVNDAPLRFTGPVVRMLNSFINK